MRDTRAMLFEAGQTAIIIAVPEAEATVGRWRAIHDDAGALGAPAHITILFPFLEATSIDDRVTEWLRDLFGRQPAFDFTFVRCGRFPGVLYLAPEPAARFRALTMSIAQRFPEAPPYGGAFDDITPHLTVAHTADEAILGQVESAVAAQLPLRATATQARLLEFTGEQWSPRCVFPLRTSAAA